MKNQKSKTIVLYIQYCKGFQFDFLLIEGIES